MVQHIVLLKLKDGVEEETAVKLFQDIGQLKDVIPGIVDYSFGNDISGGGRACGFTHGFVMTFKDAESLQAYLPHPEHGPILERVKAMAENILAFDY